MLTIESVARICHESNRAYCASMGDWSQHAWDEAPDWQKESCLDGVRFVLANPYAGPSACHENWMRQKKADGWVYGKTKDAEAKTHPCMVPFAELPEAQRVKDTLFSAIVEGLRKHIAQ